MSITAVSADGVSHVFPDGTNPDVIGKVMKQYATDHQPKTDDGSLASGLAHGAEMGVMSDWDRAAEALARGAGDVAHVVGDQEWMPGKSLTAKDLAAEKAFKQEYQNQSGFGVGKFAGEVAGSLPTAAIGGEVPGAIGLGVKALAAGGAGLETGAPGAKGAAEGAGLGVATAGAGAGAGKLIKGWVRPEAKRLMQAGVKLTPGQMRGGAFNSMEEKISGTIPITGYAIKRARDQSIHDWNTATLNNALAPIGEKITGEFKSGYEAVKETGDKLSAAYSKVLDDPNLKFIVDNQYDKDVGEIERDARLLPSDQRSQFSEIIKHALNDPEITGLPTGAQLKEGLSILGTHARQYASSAFPGERQMAGLLRDYQTALKDALERSNPQAAAAMKAADTGWAQLVRIEHAAANRVASDGVFMPSDLLAAERRVSNSVRKRSFGRGEGMLQDWARTAQKVLPSKTPDSGTAGRMIMERLLTNPLGTAGEAGAGAVAVHHPGALVAAAAGSLPYTKPGMAAVNALASRAAPVGNAVSKVGQLGSGVLSAAMQPGADDGETGEDNFTTSTAAP